MLRSFTTRFAGFLILIGGIWGGLIPFIGPSFHYALGPDKTWTWTTGRLYLDVLPAAAAVLGGLILMGAGPRLSGKVGAILALIAGIWFVVGPDLSVIWHGGTGVAGSAHGSHTVRALEPIGFHTGLGVLIAALSGYALPGFLAARRAPVAAETAAAAPAARPARPAPTTATEPATTDEPATTGEPVRQRRGFFRRPGRPGVA